MQDAPQELVDHIVDFAHDDRKTLCAARLISRSWNISARVHLFRKLDLLIVKPGHTSATPTAIAKTNAHVVPSESTPPASLAPTHSSQCLRKPSEQTSVDKFKWLLDILQTSPDMPYFVREVVIGNTNKLSRDQWQLYELVLSLVLSKLKRVTTLYLREVDWSSLSPSSATSVMELCQSPELKHLDVWNCQMPSMEGLMDFLNFSCGLTSLRLSHIRLESRSQDNNDADPDIVITPHTLGVINKLINRPRKPLQKLTIETVPLVPMLYALLATTPCSVDITKLKSLFLTHINDVPSVRDFLQAAGSSLESLEMWASSCQRQYSTDHGLDLILLPRLKQLRLSGMQWTPGMSPADCMERFFSNVNALHPLESLHVILNAVKRKTEEFNYSKWMLLDDVLSRSDLFPVLKKVHIVVYSASMRPQDVDLERLENAFPGLQANAKIQVVCM
ncbi:hypothetical protein B0H34DRAFT_800753 [Crassisporium funariophilum]|nr:hypothetical protein B0H34DRAFT_800753 [Crassisporium funariophilum]